MPTLTDRTTVKEAFFHLLDVTTAQASRTRPCPELPDSDWIRLGVQRVLEGCESGRAFLQEHGLRFDHAPTLGNYFASLRSRRRGEFVHEVAEQLIPMIQSRLVDRLADIPELARYACFACDGHWHKAATHDPRHRDTKMAVGHFYSLDLRFHSLRHLAAGQGLHEHDMSALKRIKPKGLRQGVPKGRRVLIIYDRAGVDLGYWKRCRQECAVYFLSRPKENMVFGWEADRAWNRADARNRGVVSDLWVQSPAGHRLRLITFVERQSGQVFEFLTNEPDLPPGVLAELYRRRWEAEKVFDEVKNKLGQQKAWATTLEAKEAQAHLIAITHNLLLCYETALERRHGVENRAEDHRRRQRVQSAAQECARIGWPLPALVLRARRATQRSVKLIRWVRQAIREGRTEAAAVPHLRALYATL